MAFELTISTPDLPADLKSQWESALAPHGFDVEICPDFTPTNWGGGFLPFHVRAAPENLIGFPLPGDAVSGFEVDFMADMAHFRSASGRPTTEFALLCLSAATLAQLTGGFYCDPQSGGEHAAADAVPVALGEIESFLRTARDSEFVNHAFPGWNALL